MVFGDSRFLCIFRVSSANENILRTADLGYCHHLGHCCSNLSFGIGCKGSHSYVDEHRIAAADHVFQTFKHQRSCQSDGFCSIDIIITIITCNAVMTKPRAAQVLIRVYIQCASSIKHRLSLQCERKTLHTNLTNIIRVI